MLQQVTGSVAIELDVRTPTPCVVLHAAHMNVTAVTLLGAGMTDGVPGEPGYRLHMACIG